MRSWYSLEVIMAMPVMCRNARPFIAHPFIYPEDYVAQITSPDESAALAPKDHPHVIHLALEWREALRAAPSLTMAELARRQCLSRARVTQILNILTLPAAIIKELTGIRTAEDAWRFPEHVLRKIRLLKSPDAQLAAFRMLRTARAGSEHLGSPHPPSMRSDGVRTPPESTPSLGSLVSHAADAEHQRGEDDPVHGAPRDAGNKRNKPQVHGIQGAESTSTTTEGTPMDETASNGL